MFLTPFRRLPTTFRRFPKIFQTCSESLTNVSEHFSNIFRRLPKISKGSGRFPKRHWWCFDHTTPPLSTFERLCSYSNGNLKTCDNNLIFSRVKIFCYLHVWRYHVYARKYFTGVYQKHITSKRLTPTQCWGFLANSEPIKIYFLIRAIELTRELVMRALREKCRMSRIIL